MSGFAHASLRTRLVLLVLIGVIPALGFIFYNGWSQRRLAEQLMKDNALRMVRLAALEQDQIIDGTRHLLMAMAQLPEVRNRDRQAATTILRKLRNENQPKYTNFGLIDLNGNVLFSALPIPAGTNLKDRSYFQRTVQTRDFSIGTYQVGRITGKPAINFGYPVFDSAGRLSTVIFAAVDLAWLSRLIAEAQLPDRTDACVVEQNGTILARYPKGESWIGKRLPIPELTTAIASQTEGTLSAPGTDGRQRFYAFTDLGHERRLAGIYVIIGIPAQIAYAPVFQALLRNLIGLAVAAALALVAAWIGGDIFILRRVRRLLGATRRLAGGDLDSRTGLDYGMGELGELSRSFDEMAAALQTRAAQRECAERELKALNEVLELRVEERTQQLLEKTRQMEDDLEMARELQEAFLPHQPSGALRLASTGGALEFFYRYHPTGKIGGDFFDVLRLPGARAGVFICDVMGQGIRAALVTAIVRGLVEELRPMAGSAGEFMTQINRGLSAVFRQTGTPMFASAFYMIADLDTGRLEFANAGHPSPFHLQQETCEVRLLHDGRKQHEPALGLIDDFTYPDYETTVNHGDLVILYTDGIYEVEGAEGEFGEGRLLKAVHKRIMLPPLVLFDELIKEIQQYSATKEFSDDVCVVGMQVSRRQPD